MLPRVEIDSLRARVVTPTNEVHTQCTRRAGNRRESRTRHRLLPSRGEPASAAVFSPAVCASGRPGQLPPDHGLMRYRPRAATGSASTPARAHRRLWAAVLLCTAIVQMNAGTAAATAMDLSGPSSSAPVSPDAPGSAWQWPMTGARVVAPFFRAPARAYGPGHRGIDLAAEGSQDVLAPASGTVAFAGSIAGRGVVTIDHGGGLVSTLEPITARVAVGDRVGAGDSVGRLSVGGHAEPGTLHLGARRLGDYIDPLLLLGAARRAVLLPCCDQPAG